MTKGRSGHLPNRGADDPRRTWKALSLRERDILLALWKAKRNASFKRAYASNSLDLSEFGSNLLNGFFVGFLENLTPTV